MPKTPEIEQEMPKAYEPASVEQKWYKFWLEKGYFTPKIDPKRKPFVIIMPPTNVTGELHLGHALTATLEDTMVRWHRMKGEARKRSRSRPCTNSVTATATPSMTSASSTRATRGSLRPARRRAVL